MAMDERIWLHHPDTGGWFHCPADAVATFTALGWEISETAPEQPNPVVAERIALQREQDADADESAKAAKPTTKPRRGTTENEEG